MPVDCLATESHYLAHLRPIWDGLGPERGTFWIAGLAADTITAAEATVNMRVGWPGTSNLPVMVASYKDEQTCANLGRNCIYVEHGAGQAYRGDPVAARDPSYSGGEGHDRAILFLCPNETVVSRWKARYPDTPAVAVGCPKLDRWHQMPRRPANDPPLVAITFHSEAGLLPETNSALGHFSVGLQALAQAFQGRLLGHAHPRQWGRVRGFYDRLGVHVVADMDQVLAHADLLIVDNSSAAFEFMSLGRPVLWMTPPWYRRNVDHGLRFWEMADGGMEVTDPSKLAGAAKLALLTADDYSERRAEISRAVYGACDGGASGRAVQVIGAVLAARGQASPLSEPAQTVT